VDDKPCQPPIFLGDAAVHSPRASEGGGCIVRRGERVYKIANYHSMRPFFMSVVSGYDHWLFISSTGGLTCGRRDPENALFPYCTDDKLHDAQHTTGPKTVLLVSRGDRRLLWQPFGDAPLTYEIERNLYKSVTGNKLEFEEVNHSLGLTFSYSWTTGDRFGFIRDSRLVNNGNSDIEVELLDGLRNILPSGVDRGAQSEMSTLVDGYKQVEAIPELSAALCTLSSILTDRAEPSEALRATIIWSCGLEAPKLLLSEDQLSSLQLGRAIKPEPYCRGKRAAFFVQTSMTLPANAEQSWKILADVEQGPSQVANLLNSIRAGITASEIETDAAEGTTRLQRLAGGADGFQHSADPLVDGRHFSNTLFNIMRGGVFPYEYLFPKDDFLDFVKRRNRKQVKKVQRIFAGFSEELTLKSALQLAGDSGNEIFLRLVHEYLPLTFSRRHGDPSRPWNHFSILLKNDDGSESLNYQGNWRDIFQNWEALALSFPEYIESFVAKFVNASTPDGHNPYRISRDGIDWEAPEPDVPWSNIGYWGDHQIVYLLRLLQLSRSYHPGRLVKALTQDGFVYADVPYRIKPYDALLTDPRNSVDYDHLHDKRIRQRVAKLGADGKLVTLKNGSIYSVNLFEKLLVPALTKFGNLVPSGGIWMNTQRPEWNDANNALVGYGLSMVTLCHLRRYLHTLDELLDEASQAEFEVSKEVALYFRSIQSIVSDKLSTLTGPISAASRKSFMDEIGRANEHYRSSVSSGFVGDKESLDGPSVREFIGRALQIIEQSIADSRREDGLYHSYNLIHFGVDGYDVEPLDVMLEGQVAVLSCGHLKPDAAVKLLGALRASRLYREDQNSYILYPDRTMPSFLKKNRIPSSTAESFDWISQQLSSGRTTYIERDLEGGIHFNPTFKNAGELRAAMEQDRSIESADMLRLCDIYEQLFRHREFTGRSGSMFKYEGLGCIYWHMVSKLLLTTGEAMTATADSDEDKKSLEALASSFDEIRDGLGLHKSPEQYGAFPVDAYSHTTGFSGVQQPGLTGQVKEDVIMRFLQLGVRAEDGQILFEPKLLSRAEFIQEPSSWRFTTGDTFQHVELEAQSLGFTLFGVPIIYRIAETAQIEIFANGKAHSVIRGSRLGAEVSRSLFEREQKISKLIVDVPRERLR
jgi:hypothetical protein